MTESNWPAYLQAAMKRAGFRRPSDLARATGINDNVISGWLRRGQGASIENLRKLRNGLAHGPHPWAVSLVELQVAAGLITSEEARLNGHPSVPESVPVDPIEEEILDMDLSKKDKETLLAVRRTQRDQILTLVEELRREGAFRRDGDPTGVHTA